MFPDKIIMSKVEFQATVQHCLILRFAIDKENLTVLLNLRSLSFIANRSLFFITQYWFMLWRRWIGGCVYGQTTLFKSWDNYSNFCRSYEKSVNKQCLLDTPRTLKMRSRSVKSNHFFPPSHWSICASLVKFHLLIHEIECTQGSFLECL